MMNILQSNTSNRYNSNLPCQGYGRCQDYRGIHITLAWEHLTFPYVSLKPFPLAFCIKAKRQGSKPANLAACTPVKSKRRGI